MTVNCCSCGMRSKKLPSSWVQNDCQIYCPCCWSNVECRLCMHHDPKGCTFKGAWNCRACQHKHRNRGVGSLETCHQIIIKDDNGETSLPKETAGSSSPLDLSQARPGLPPVHQDEGEDEDAKAEAEEMGDSLAPLRQSHEAQAKHLVLLLDASGSMRLADVEGAGTLIGRLEAAAQCAAEFARAHARRRPQDTFSLAAFNENVEIIAALHDAEGLAQALECWPKRGSHGTFYKPALEEAARLLHKLPSSGGHVVLLSDSGPADTRDALQFFQDKGLGEAPIHGIGFGDGVASFGALQQLACLSGGTFGLSGCSLRSLSAAFFSVSTTITSSRSAAGTSTRQLRSPRFEVPELGVFGKRFTLSFSAARAAFLFDGTSFHEQKWPPSHVVRRAQPYMRGGMRLVYGFQDEQVSGKDGSWMVAKCSRYLDESLNVRGVVEAHAKSTAVARYLAARFNQQMRQLPEDGPRPPTIFFVPCFVYDVTGTSLPPEEPAHFAAERYLPGAFLKYNSNNGYVAESSLKHHEAVQAFLHFSWEATEGQLLVADLQGVARAGEVLLTDPQVLSLTGCYGPGDLRGGIAACLGAHRCGPSCKRLGLRPPRFRPSRGDRQTSSCLSSSWDQVGEAKLQDFAMSDGLRSSQASSSSWVNVEH